MASHAERFKRGDYVSNVVAGFYDDAIWIVVSDDGERVRCQRPFNLIEHAAVISLAMVGNGFYDRETVSFRKEDLVSATRLVVKAKLMGCKIPTLGDK